MSQISRTTALAVAVFTFCLASGAPAWAKTPTRHQHAHGLSHPSYAGPMAATPATRVMLYRANHLIDDSCDLPSSGCTDDQRIAN
jgi:hypothetical protein